jgi:hypothetical protein
VKQGSGISASADASASLLRLRPWFLGLSIVLLGIGFGQQRRARQCAVKGRIVGQVLLSGPQLSSSWE